jgi:hypothetical protein
VTEDLLIAAFYRRQVQNVKDYVDGQDDEAIRSLDPDAWADAVVRGRALCELNVRGWTMRKERVDGDVGVVLQVELERCTNLRDSLRHHPGSGSALVEPLMNLEENVIYVHTTPANVGSTKAQVAAALDARNREIAPQNLELRAWARHCVVVRQEEIDAEDTQLSELGQVLGIELTRRSDPRASPIELGERAEINVIRTAPHPSARPESRLNPSQLALVLVQIDRMGRQFEVTPETYSKLQEEDLRNIIVGLLNAVFAAGASVVGEGFHKQGQTDVLLRASSGAVFVGECKFWHGEVAYAKALDQLFSYLTHRETDVALITFVRNQDFTRVVDAARAATDEHASLSERSSVNDDGKFRSRHRLPGDNSKSVIVHHMLYALPTNAPGAPTRAGT